MGHVPDVSHFVRVGFDTIWCVSVPKEGYANLLDVVFFAVEYQVLSFCWLYQVDELSVMVFLILTENNNVVGYGFHACQTVKMLIHPAL